MIARMRASSRPSASSASRSKSAGTCQSIRKVESGQGWISTWRPGFHSGSKWKRRSVSHPGRSARMSQIRNRSSKECPAKSTPSRPRIRSPRAPAAATAYAASTRTSPAAVAQVSTTVRSSCPIAVTSWPQRTSMRGSAAMASSRTCSERHWLRLTNGGSGEWPRSVNDQENSSRSRWKVRAVSQVRPSSAIRPAPTEAQMSRTSRCWQMAFDPTASRSRRASSSTTGMPRRASSRAVVWPTGPLPTTATGGPLYGGRESIALTPATRPRPRGRARRSRSVATRCRPARPRAAAR